MDSYELSKISAAVLLALLLIFVPKTLMEMNSGGHGGDYGEKKANHGYKLPTVEVAGAAAPAAEPVKFDPTSVVAMVASADAGAGEKQFKKCIGCHSVESGASHKVGPNLWNLVGRAKGSADGFGGYSSALKGRSSEPWDYAALAGFLHKPKEYLPGTKMVFRGIKKDGDLANLIAYLRTLSDSPVALP